MNHDDDKGILGLFCWGIDNSSCPSISEQFISKGSPDTATDKTIMRDLLSKAGYEVKIEKYKNCVNGNDNYSCSITGAKKDYAVVLSIGYVISSNEKSLTVHLGQKSGIGIN